ncbi:hypothetical protein SESBI_26823 [Sesbania bispinosa]|nr:hypothetical protein SESBI_26823 [Sesbania bispinosa]
MNVVKAGREQGQTHQQQGRARKGYDHRGRNFSAKTGWADHQRPEPAGNYGLAAMTPLNTTRAWILREVYQSDLIRLPPQSEGPKGPDMNKWCDYHRARGHDTENCWTLMNRIERLNKEGYLGRDDRHKEGRGKEEVRGVVTTIAGGFTGGGETSSARRRYARQVMTIQTDLQVQGANHPTITFTNDDFQGIQPHQDDPMVIEVLMAKYRVQRVLIDQGSSADVLYWSTFEKLQLPKECLLPFAGSLMGFAGDSVEEAARRCYRDSLKVRRRNWPEPQVKEKESAENHKVFFAELDPREDFFERRPQPTEELEEKEESWIAPILHYINGGSLPADLEAAKKIQKDSAKYAVIGGLLFRRGF